MGKKEREAGARFERKIAGDLHDMLGIRFKRDLRQYQSADRSDLIPDDDAFPFSIECKRRAAGATCESGWEAQAIRAAQNEGRHPSVIYQFGSRAPIVRIWSEAYAESLGTTAVDGVKLDLSLEHFAHVCREIMAVRATRNQEPDQ